MKLSVKLLNEQAKMPTKGSCNAAGYDLYACIEKPITIWPGTCEMIPTGLAMAIPDGYFGGIYARSGLSTKHGIRLANSTAVIDADYRGEIIVPLYNDSETEFKILPEDRIAQMIIQPCPMFEFECVDTLPTSERNTGGFGSSGR